MANPDYQDHPARDALNDLWAHYTDLLNQLERLTAISDGYQSVLRERNQSLTERYRKQLRQLQRIVRISDHYQGMLQDLNDQLKVASTHDLLTGLPNRRLMTERLESEVARCARSHAPFSILLGDVDRFKRVNDSFGHDVGDKALMHIARALSKGLRSYDTASRWGGEEFLLFLPDTPGEVALEVANRLRQSVEELRDAELPQGLALSISIGVAEHRVDADLNQTIKRADTALYTAKHTGRNRVCVAP